MSLNLYVLEGPADAGNCFGYWKPGLLKAGQFSVVYDDEYTNGGHGPTAANGRYYSTKEAAEKELRRLQGVEEVPSA